MANAVKSKRKKMSFKSANAAYKKAVYFHCIQAVCFLLCSVIFSATINGMFVQTNSNAKPTLAESSTNAFSNIEPEIFGETNEEETTQSDIRYKISMEVQNIEVATGDSKKDEDAEVSRDFGTNSSHLKPAEAPTLKRLGAKSLPKELIKSGITSSYKYVHRGNMQGLQSIDNIIFNFDANHNPITGHQTIDKVKYFFNENGAKGSLVGIDVSNHNGKIDWARVKAAGVDFAIIRVGFRGYGTDGKLKLDSQFEANMQGAKAVGIAVGVYFYSQATTEAEALEEASVAVNYSRKYNPELPIYIDTEFTTPAHDGRADALSAGTRTKCVVAFCEAVKNAGFTPGVYASKTFFTDHLLFEKIKSYEIWVAHYTSETTDFKYPYAVWQYTSKGTVDGIPNKTDINMALYDYKNKKSMKAAGRNVIFLDSDAEYQQAKIAENNLNMFKLFRTEEFYNNTKTQISKIGNEYAQKVLQEELEHIKMQAIENATQPPKKKENPTSPTS